MKVYIGATLGGVGSSSPIVPYTSQSFLIGQLAEQPIGSLGLICTVSGALTYSVQVTGDYPQAAITNWVNHSVLNGLTQSAYSNIVYPISALRLVVTAWTSGFVNLGVVQWP
jgi:hypothetical protein